MGSAYGLLNQVAQDFRNGTVRRSRGGKTLVKLAVVVVADSNYCAIPNQDQRRHSQMTKKVDAGGGQMVDLEVPNGKHKVKIVCQKIGKGKSYNGATSRELFRPRARFSLRLLTR
jgi:hypothetical protein